MSRLGKRFVELLRTITTEQKGIATIPTIVGMVSVMAVAGTFASGVLSQGSEATQEVQQAVDEAIQQIKDTYQVRGSVIGMSTGTGSNKAVGQLTFAVSLAMGGGSVDFTPPAASDGNTGLADPTSTNMVTISYTDEYQHVDNLFWTLAKYGKNDGDDILEDDEMFQITIGGSQVAGEKGGNLVDALRRKLSADTTFDIEIKAPQGATLHVERRTPAGLNNVVNLH